MINRRKSHTHVSNPLCHDSLRGLTHSNDGMCNVAVQDRIGDVMDLCVDVFGDVTFQVMRVLDLSRVFCSREVVEPYHIIDELCQVTHLIDGECQVGLW